jgi:hypothetical protein
MNAIFFAKKTWQLEPKLKSIAEGVPLLFKGIRLIRLIAECLHEFRIVCKGRA